MQHRLLCVVLLALLLAGCSSMGPQKDGPPPFPVDVSKIPDATPKKEPLSKYGNPATYVVNGKRYHVLKSAAGYNRVGYASWYGTKFDKRLTSSREPYDMLGMTAASTTLPLPTYVRVTNLANGNQVIVKVNDRGPFHSTRILDLSYVAAKKLGIVGRGTGLVRVTAINPDDYGPNRHFYAKNDLASPAPTDRAVKPTQLAANTDDVGKAFDKQYVQVGSFSNRANAHLLGQKLAKLTQTQVAIKEILHNNRPLYRVQIGPVNDTDHYQRLVETLAAEGFSHPITING